MLSTPTNSVSRSLPAGISLPQFWMQIMRAKLFPIALLLFMVFLRKCASACLVLLSSIKQECLAYLMSGARTLICFIVLGHLGCRKENLSVGLYLRWSMPPIGRSFVSMSVGQWRTCRRNLWMAYCPPLKKENDNSGSALRHPLALHQNVL